MWRFLMLRCLSLSVTRVRGELGGFRSVRLLSWMGGAALGFRAQIALPIFTLTSGRGGEFTRFDKLAHPVRDGGLGNPQALRNALLRLPLEP